MKSEQKPRKGTIMVVNGNLDYQLNAFIIACGFQCMGTEMTLWFNLWGANALKRKKKFTFFGPKTPILRQSERLDKPVEEGVETPSLMKPHPGRNIKTDHFLQDMVGLLNSSDYNNLPLSTLHYMGVGPKIMKFLTKRKGIPSLQTLIEEAYDLGVQFKICQICVDTFSIDVNDLVVDKVVVGGVTDYHKDSDEAHINLFV